MITSEERRAIAARIGAIDWGDAEGSWHFIDRLRYAMGVDYMDTYKDDMMGIADKVRELCEANGLDAMSDEDPSSHGLMRLPKGADGEPIRLGDVVIHPDMGGRRKVTSVCFAGEGVSVGLTDGFATLRADLLSHADTPSTLADEIDRWVGSGQDEPLDELRGIAERLRALGGSGDE